MKKYTAHNGVEFSLKIGDYRLGQSADWLLMATTISVALGMKHPDEHGSSLGNLIDQVIRDHGDYLFMGLVYLMIALGIWIFVRRRMAPPNHRVTAVPTLSLEDHPQTGECNRTEDLDFQIGIERLDNSGKDRDSSSS